ncbi:MAG TPA: nucleotide disphospho-sugar-binding domain-containing protein [Thermoleophilaceae bacterium]|nr:nucleotide disphospho-sugar-binding domain-containing protein [Thermoleophilaceae bacterium]
MLLAAFGDPGHAFPMIALGRELAARGHEVVLQTWQKWEEHVEREGMRFLRAPEYQVFPTLESPMKPYAAGVRAAKETQPLIRELDPEVVVADILTVAAALAAQAEERPWVTLVPHVIPWGEPSFPPYSVGAVRARTSLGARLWALTRPVLMAGERQGRRELNGARERIGLPPLDYVQGGMSRLLSLIATFPQLEYPREHPLPWARITGPLLWEQPFGDVELPPGDDPLVLVAPSTSQDREHRLLRATLEGLEDEPVRVLASTNRRSPGSPLRVPANAKLVDWVSYARTMPKCDAVICHAGHGTLARALVSGVPVVACPAEGDMAENAARIRWAGVGVSLPRRLQTPRGVRLALRRLLADPQYAARARGLGEWAARNDGAAAAADAVEGLAGANVRFSHL